MSQYYLIYENGVLVETCRKSDWDNEEILQYASAKYNNPFVRGIHSKKTSIKLNDDVKSKLESLKTHPRETYEDVILRLISHFEKE